MRSAEGPFGRFGFGEDAEDAASPVFFIIMVAGDPFDSEIRLTGGPFDATAGFFAPVSSLLVAAMGGPGSSRCPV